MKALATGGFYSRSERLSPSECDNIYQTVKENEKHWGEAKCFMEETARNTEPIPEFEKNSCTRNV